jgi:uncharacterized membrane protein YfcA
LLLGLSPWELAYGVAVLLFTFGLRGSLGFGGSVGLPLLALVIPVKVLAPAWSLIGIVSSATIIGRDRKHVSMADFLGLMPGCLLGVLAGLFVFKTLDAALLARALGGFVLLYACYTAWMATRPADAKPPISAAILKPFASFFSGAVGTMFGAMASIFFTLYVAAGGANKHVLRATVSAMLLTLSVIRTTGYAAVDELTPDSLILCAAAIPFMGLGLLFGDKIHSGLSERAFQRMVAGALFVCGLPLVLK